MAQSIVLGKIFVNQSVDLGSASIDLVDSGTFATSSNLSISSSSIEWASSYTGIVQWYFQSYMDTAGEVGEISFVETDGADNILNVLRTETIDTVDTQYSTLYGPFDVEIEAGKTYCVGRRRVQTTGSTGRIYLDTSFLTIPN